MTIALMRHGQTDWNLAGRVQGHTNIPLNDTGREQARQAAAMLAESGHDWLHITSSPLDRARETAQIIADHLGTPLGDPLDALIEQHYGEAEGTPVADIDKRWPGRIFTNGELPEDVARRALDTLEYLSTTFNGGRVLAVTHGAYIRRLVATLQRVEYHDVPGIVNATVSTFERDESGKWVVTTINNEPTETMTAPTIARSQGQLPRVVPVARNEVS